MLREVRRFGAESNNNAEGGEVLPPTLLPAALTLEFEPWGATHWECLELTWPCQSEHCLSLQPSTRNAAVLNACRVCGQLDQCCGGSLCRAENPGHAGECKACQGSAPGKWLADAEDGPRAKDYPWLSVLCRVKTSGNELRMEFAAGKFARCASAACDRVQADPAFTSAQPKGCGATIEWAKVVSSGKALVTITAAVSGGRVVGGGAQQTSIFLSSLGDSSSSSGSSSSGSSAGGQESGGCLSPHAAASSKDALEDALLLFTEAYELECALAAAGGSGTPAAAASPRFLPGALADAHEKQLEQVRLARALAGLADCLQVHQEWERLAPPEGAAAAEGLAASVGAAAAPPPAPADTRARLQQALHALDKFMLPDEPLHLSLRRQQLAREAHQRLVRVVESRCVRGTQVFLPQRCSPGEADLCTDEAAMRYLEALQLWKEVYKCLPPHDASSPPSAQAMALNPVHAMAREYLCGEAQRMAAYAGMLCGAMEAIVGGEGEEDALDALTRQFSAPGQRNLSMHSAKFTACKNKLDSAKDSAKRRQFVSVEKEVEGLLDGTRRGGAGAEAEDYALQRAQRFAQLVGLGHALPCCKSPALMGNKVFKHLRELEERVAQRSGAQGGSAAKGGGAGPQ